MTSPSSSPSSSKASSQESGKHASRKQPARKKTASKTDQKSAADVVTPKRPCRVTVSAPGWHGARTAAIAAGCSSVSDMIEKLGSGELSIIASDAMLPEDLPRTISSQTTSSQTTSSQTASQQSTTSAQPQHIHIHTASSAPVASDDDDLIAAPTSLPKLITTGICAAVIVGSLLYIADRIIAITSNVITDRENIEDIITPRTGDIVAGYDVSDEYGIRPFHPVTGAPNVPHNGVDLAMDIGTPIHAVGKAGDRVTVKCWWDDGGGGWVVNQTAESYPGYTFQSLHMSKNGCREGQATAGDAIAYSGNSGLGTGVHYDFRVKIEGEYVPPATKYLESAITGKPPKE